ncbi:hypothetical protein JW835_04035 [bacterium]|nr:hypothetical protein [bacterium]RQV97964.1 MAG: hypothetical protein EH221_03130 [bacterium]
MRQRIFMVIVIGFILILPLAAQNDYIIIVNNSIQDETLNQANIKNIFLGKKSRWTDGTKIVPVNLKQGKIHESFIKEMVQKSTNAYMNYWRKMIFTGKGVMPISFENEAEVVRYISRTKGAIGYVSSSAQLEESEQVKVVSLTD